MSASGPSGPLVFQMPQGSPFIENFLEQAVATQQMINCPLVYLLLFFLLKFILNLSQTIIVLENFD